MKIYIAGKIAGDRRYRAKFREAAKAMEAAGRRRCTRTGTRPHTSAGWWN